MSRSPRGKRRARQPSAICARAWTSTGTRLPSDAYLEPNNVVADPRLSVAAESVARRALPLLSQLFVLCAYRDRTIRSFARCPARPAPTPPLSPLERGRLRPSAGKRMINAYHSHAAVVCSCRDTVLQLRSMDARLSVGHARRRRTVGG